MEICPGLGTSTKTSNSFVKTGILTRIQWKSMSWLGTPTQTLNSFLSNEILTRTPWKSVLGWDIHKNLELIPNDRNINKNSMEIFPGLGHPQIP
jgi:hypothetical protein